MRKQVLIRCALGFLLGIVMMYLVPSLINHSPVVHIIYSDRLLERVGSPLAAALLTLLLMGLFGALCVGGTLFYEIERWPLALATAAHYLAISLGYLIPVRVLSWELPPKLLLTIEGLMTLGFILIWLSMYLRYKALARELNELTQKRKQEKDKKEQEEIR